MKTSPGLAPVAVALACGTSGFDPLEDTRKVFDVALGEGIEEMASDRLQVGGCGGLEHGAPGVGDGDLGRARVASAALALDQAFALEVDRDPRHLTGAEAYAFGEVRDADCTGFRVGDVHDRLEGAQREVVLGEQASVEGAQHG